MLGRQLPRLPYAPNVLFRKTQGTRTLARYCLDGRKILNRNSEKTGYVSGVVSTGSAGGGIL